MSSDVVVKWVARAWSIVSGLVLFALLIRFTLAFGRGESHWPTGQQAVGLLLFPFGVATGLLIAWWRDATGGLVTVGSFALFYVWIFTASGELPPGPYLLLIAAPGFLFIASALLRGRGWASKVAERQRSL